MFNIFQHIKLLGNANAKNLNILTANDYYDRLKTIALTLFEWKGLPDSCNARFLEMSLYTFGRALFFEDPAMGYLNLNAVPSGELNVYNESIAYTGHSINYNKLFKRNECVLIRNNYLERPTDNSILLFASRLTEAERTIDVNVKAQKTPVLLRCDEKDRLTLTNLYAKYEGNEPFILGGKALNLDAINVFKTDAPFVADKLQAYKHEIWSEALTFFGINNANSDKRERLITNEVDANNQVIEVNAQAMLLTRIEACDAINKMYGLDVSVEMRNFNQVGEEQEVDEDGEV